MFSSAAALLCISFKVEAHILNFCNWAQKWKNMMVEKWYENKPVKQKRGKTRSQMEMDKNNSHLGWISISSISQRYTSLWWYVPRIWATLKLSTWKNKNPMKEQSIDINCYKPYVFGDLFSEASRQVVISDGHEQPRSLMESVWNCRGNSHHLLVSCESLVVVTCWGRA